MGWLAGADIDFYLDAARRWLGGDGFYEKHQLIGPYVFTDHEVLYPPPILILLVPFLLIPLPLWWLIPLSVSCRVVFGLRPSRLAWSVILVAMWVPNTIALILAGNPVIWGLMAASLAVRRGWPGAFLLLKPTVAPLAFVWSRRRSWWLAVGFIVTVSLPFLPMWPDYVTVLANARSPGLGNLLHSVGDLPMLLMPIVAWIGRTRRHQPRAGGLSLSREVRRGILPR